MGEDGGLVLMLISDWERVVDGDEMFDFAVLRGMETVDVAAEELVKTRLMLVIGLNEMVVDAGVPALALYGGG